MVVTGTAFALSMLQHIDAENSTGAQTWSSPLLVGHPVNWGSIFGGKEEVLFFLNIGQKLLGDPILI